jgi:DNA-binding MarR family transcriptional regulator
MFRALLEKIAGRRSRESEAERRLRPYLGDEKACVVLRLVLENPGITTEKMATRAHMDMADAGRIVARLEEDGLVTEEQGGWHVREDAKAAVAKHLPLNYQCPGMLRD